MIVEAYYFEFVLIGMTLAIVLPLLAMLWFLNRRFERRWGKD